MRLDQSDEFGVQIKLVVEVLAQREIPLNFKMF
jgi:hypothetical protein